MKKQVNLYKVLGVSHTADERTIKKAYRILSKTYHPDLNPGDLGSEKKTRQINRAWEVLGNPTKRERYDRHYQRRKIKPLGETLRENEFIHYNYRERVASKNEMNKIWKLRTVNIIRRDAAAEEYYNRGLAWQRVKKHQKSKLEYRQALKIAPKYGKAHLGFGEVCWEMGETELAVQHLNVAKMLFLQNGDLKNLNLALDLIEKVSIN
tara:strand:- start:3 stop:626 length:624 start_codon:yes stop_codon:yes gene_type:complete